MSITISTTAYEFTHGKKPRGRGSWAFIRKASHGQEDRTMFAPSWMTFREACAWCRAQVRAEGFQDANVEVGS